MRYVVTSDPGLEDVVADEIREKLPGSEPGTRAFGIDGLIRVDAPDADGLMRLATIHHVVEMHELSEIETLEDIDGVMSRTGFPELESAASFRVTSRCGGEHAFGKMDVQRVAGAALYRRYRTPVDLEGFEVEVRADLYGSRLVAGVQVTRDSLGNRIRRARALRSALRPTVAAAMLRLVGAHRGEGVLIDPMCGIGTIPIEAAALNPRLDVRAGDWDEDTVEAARKTLANHALTIDVEVADARSLGDTHPGEYDYIVTDPPYGLRQARRTSITRLYRGLLASFSDASRPTGKIALVVVKHRAFLAALEDSGLHVTSDTVVDLGGIRPHVYTLESDESRHP